MIKIFEASKSHKDFSLFISYLINERSSLTQEVVNRSEKNITKNQAKGCKINWNI
jgi:hypothetical protein